MTDPNDIPVPTDDLLLTDVPVPVEPFPDDDLTDPAGDTDDDVELAAVLAEPDEIEAPPGVDLQEDQDAPDDAVGPDVPAPPVPPLPPFDEPPGPPPPSDDQGAPSAPPSPPRTMMKASWLALTHGFAGLCLGYTRRVFGCQGKFATAFKAWKGAKLKVTVAGHPPAGVPAFFTPSKNGFGHVAPSLGGGLVRSTNSGTGKISNVPVDTITNVWHQPYLGYTLDLNGKLIAPLLASTLRRKDRGDAVVFLQGRLTWAGHKLVLDGVFGQKTEDAVKAFQKEHGLAPKGVVGHKTRKFVNAVH